MDNAAFLVNLLTIERQIMTPVVKDKQARVDSSLARGYIIYIIHCFLDAGISVELSAELHTDAFKIFNQFLHCHLPSLPSLICFYSSIYFIISQSTRGVKEKIYSKPVNNRSEQYKNMPDKM